MGEQQEDQEIDEIKSRASAINFDSGKEPEDESDIDYDPSRDH